MASPRSLALLALPALAAALPRPQDVETSIVDIDDGRIVGGKPVAPGDFPFIVSLSEGGSHFCGGSLLNSHTVLTAAHCSVGQDPSTAQVRAGTLEWQVGGIVANVSSILIHPEYDDSTFDNDIALWELATPIKRSCSGNSTIAYAELPADGSDPAANSTAVVAGWGHTEQGGDLSDRLLSVEVPVIGREQCDTLYEGNGDITDVMFCAGPLEGGRDSCQGDSGGPIIDDATGQQIGVVSWGQGCAQPEFPGVYARVGALTTFINANLFS